uniref:AAA domain-containing protein n=1 Tax=Steinernema glaseri TaxID=37863 RepID=A0A1I7ZAW9_9BILA
MGDNSLRSELISLAIRLAAGGIFTYFSVKWMIKAMDPNSSTIDASRRKAEDLLRRLGINYPVELTDHEMRIATLFVPPEDCINPDEIGGHDSLWAEVNDRVILPLALMARSKANGDRLSSLVSPPPGVLLYGPPGCGKTLMARAIAKSANARFLNLDLSILTDKWYGESQKLTSALFSVAVKFQPTIIFIDEIDSFLRNRSSNDHESTAIMKAQFMTLWDGFASGNNEIMVLGATNRREDVDEAILRRMPTQFKVPMPSSRSRAQILEKILEGEYVSNKIDYLGVASDAEHFAGSDLREACRMAALIRIRKDLKASRSARKQEFAQNPIQEADLREAVLKMKCDVATRSRRADIVSEFSRYVEESYGAFVNDANNSSTSPSQSDCEVASGTESKTPCEVDAPPLD